MKIDLKKKIKWKQRKSYFEPSLSFLFFGLVNQDRYEQYVKELSRKDQEQLYNSLENYEKGDAKKRIMLIFTAVVLGILGLGWKVIFSSFGMLIEETAEAERLFNGLFIVGAFILGMGIFVAVKLFCFEYSMRLKYKIVKKIIEKSAE